MVFTGWEQTSSFEVGHIPIEIYRSTTSGMQVLSNGEYVPTWTGFKPDRFGRLC